MLYFDLVPTCQIGFRATTSSGHHVHTSRRYIHTFLATLGYLAQSLLQGGFWPPKPLMKTSHKKVKTSKAILCHPS